MFIFPKNGFYHTDPCSQDIVISPEMVKEVGHTMINARIEHSHIEGKEMVADCLYNGTLYKVKNESFCGQCYWLVVGKQ